MATRQLAAILLVLLAVNDSWADVRVRITEDVISKNAPSDAADVEDCEVITEGTRLSARYATIANGGWTAVALPSLSAPSAQDTGRVCWVPNSVVDVRERGYKGPIAAIVVAFKFFLKGMSVVSSLTQGWEWINNNWVNPVELKPGDVVEVLRLSGTMAEVRFGDGKQRWVQAHRIEEVAELEPEIFVDSGRVNTVYGLFVGVADYTLDDELKLKYAAMDAREMHRIFTENFSQYYGVPATNFVLLTDADATPERITGTLGTLAAKAGPDDALVVFISMHGIPDGDDLYFQPVRGISADPGKFGLSSKRLRAILENTQASRKLLLVDSCYSARIGGLKGHQPGAQGPQEYIRQMGSTGKGSLTFASSQATQPSKEAADYCGGHGAFTCGLLQGLAGNADGVKGGKKDGVVRLRELVDYTHDYVARIRERQQVPWAHGSWDFDMPLAVARNVSLDITGPPAPPLTALFPAAPKPVPAAAMSPASASRTVSTQVPQGEREPWLKFHKGAWFWVPVGIATAAAITGMSLGAMAYDKNLSTKHAANAAEANERREQAESYRNAANYAFGAGAGALILTVDF